MNLLEETKKEILKHGREPERDVLYVGSEDGRLQMTWEQAVPVLDVEYHEGYGSNEIAIDLCVRFKDGALMVRHVYDGAEWWRYIPTPAEQGVPFKNVKTNHLNDYLQTLNYPMGIPDTKEEA